MSDPVAADTASLADALRAAETHAAAGRHAEAADGYDAALDRAPADADVHRAAAGSSFRAGRLDRAVELYTRVTQLTPAHADALVNLGAVHNRAGRHAEAERVLKKAIVADRNCAEGFYNLGIARRKMGRKKPAADAYKEAVRINPRFAEAQQNLGNLLLDLGRPRPAADAFRAALKARPGFAKAAAGLKAAEAKLDERVTDAPPVLPPAGVRASAAGEVRRNVQADGFPPLSARRRARDRADLKSLARQVEEAAVAWADALKHDISAQLTHLEHVILGAGGSALADATADLDDALVTADARHAACRSAVLKLRAHEELIRAPKLPRPDGTGGDTDYDLPAGPGGDVSGDESGLDLPVPSSASSLTVPADAG